MCWLHLLWPIARVDFCRGDKSDFTSSEISEHFSISTGALMFQSEATVSLDTSAEAKLCSALHSFKFILPKKCSRLLSVESEVPTHIVQFCLRVVISHVQLLQGDAIKPQVSKYIKLLIKNTVVSGL